MQAKELSEAEVLRNKFKQELLVSLSKIDRTASVKMAEVLKLLGESLDTVPGLFAELEQDPELNVLASKNDPVELCKKVLRALGSGADENQFKTLLEILFRHKLYNLLRCHVLDSIYSILGDRKLAAFIEFYLAHLDDPLLLPVGGKYFYEMSDQQSQTVVRALRDHSGVCVEFLRQVSLTEKCLNLPKRKQLTGLLLELCEDKHLSLADCFIQFGFLPLSTTVFPLLGKEQELEVKRLELLKDRRVKLTLEQVEVILKTEKKPSLEYLNALSLAMYQTGEDQNPSRPRWFSKHLESCHQLDSCDEEDKELFRSALSSPLAKVAKVHLCKSTAVLVALFEQFSLLDVTKKMYFLEKPVAVMSAYLSHNGTISTGRNENVVYTNEHLKAGVYNELPALVPVFGACCKTLAKRMNAGEARRILCLLISDQSLHPQINVLLCVGKVKGPALEGYAPLFLETVLNPKVDPKLKERLLPYGGFIIEKMSADEFSQFLNWLLTEKRYKELSVLLIRCRALGSELSDEVGLRLCQLFLEDVKWLRNYSPITKRFAATCAQV